MTVGGTTTTPSLPATPAAPATPETPTTPEDDGGVKPGDPGFESSAEQSGFFAMASAMGRRLGSMAEDGLSLAGVETTEDGPNIKFENLATIGAVNVGIAGTLAMAKRANLPPGITQTFGETATQGAREVLANGIRITPTLVSAFAGPVIADGVHYLAPNLLPKIIKENGTAANGNAHIKKTTEPEKQKITIIRGVVAAAAIGLAAGVTFLLKPDLFGKLGVNFISPQAIKGATHYTTSAGTSGMMLGVQTAADILKIGGERLAGETVTIVKTIAPMARDAAFTNRLILGTAGGLGTLWLANEAAGKTGDERRNWGIAAAVTGAATIAGIGAMGKLTNAIAPLQKTGFVFKPNIEWVKSFATKVLPITGSPAYVTASTYYDIVSGFTEISKPNSPFRKATN